MLKMVNAFKFFGIKNLLNIITSSYVYESKEQISNVKINHKLNSDNLLIQVWVKENNFYYNDIVPITIIDKNNVQIHLPKEAILKVVIEKAKYDKIFTLLDLVKIPFELFDDFRNKILKV